MQHLIAVDPYYAYVSDNTKTVLDVPDIAVMLEDHFEDAPESVNIQQLIEKSWDGENTSEKEYQASDWQKIIDKALGSAQDETDFSIGEFEEVSEEEMNKPSSEIEPLQPHSRREAFLKKLQSTSRKEKNSIPDWIFDQNGDLVQQVPEELEEFR